VARNNHEYTFRRCHGAVLLPAPNSAQHGYRVR
jgi:hypothetical protein